MKKHSTKRGAMRNIAPTSGGSQFPAQPMNYPNHMIPPPNLGNGIGTPGSPGSELSPGSDVYGS